MQLEGDLTRTTLGDLLGRVHRARLTGVLTLHGESCQRFDIHLSEGQVTHVRGPTARTRLGDLLRRESDLSARERARLEGACVRRSRRSVGDVWVEAGIIGPEQLLRALDLQSRIRLEDAFQLQAGRVAFHVVSEPAPRWAPRLEPRYVFWGRPRARGRSTAAVGRSGREAWLKELGLAEGASERQIRVAFRALARTLHPDRGGSVNAFQQLSAAYHSLLAEANG